MLRYYLLFGPLFLLSLLPLRILYLLSELLNIFLFKFVRYRNNVIHGNLSRSFPNKSAEEIKGLQKSFQRYFCDLIFETLKTLSISPKQVSKLVKFKNLHLFEKYYSKGQSIIIVLGHHGNWELIGAAFAPLPYHNLYIIYHPLNNRTVERLIYHMRTRLGNKLYTMKGTMRGMLANRHETTATAFIADQTPSPDRAYWTTFLNQDTPVFMGTEKIAQKLNYPIIYMSIRRPKRGHYIVTARELTDAPRQIPEYQISATHTQWLEEDIRSQPEIWLWSHRRWKHQRPK